MNYDEMHKQWYEDGGRITIVDGVSKQLNWTRWMGVEVQKNPMDLFIYQEIIYDTRPEMIIETGSAGGGSALFFASILDQMCTSGRQSRGMVFSIDNSVELIPSHPRICFYQGDSVSYETLRVAEEWVKDKRVMVVLDSAHDREHVLAEMELYNKFVTEGCYMVVEDTNINGHPVLPAAGDGPWEAVEEFMKHNDRFVADTAREHYAFTFNPGGWLRKKRAWNER